MTIDYKITLYDEKTGKHTDLNPDQIKHILEWLTRKQNEEMQKELK